MPHLDVSVADSPPVEVVHRQHQLLEEPPGHSVSSSVAKGTWSALEMPHTCGVTVQQSVNRAAAHS